MTKNSRTILLTVIITALIVGGGAYAGFRWNDRSSKVVQEGNDATKSGQPVKWETALPPCDAQLFLKNAVVNVQNKVDPAAMSEFGLSELSQQGFSVHILCHDASQKRVFGILAKEELEAVASVPGVQCVDFCDKVAFVSFDTTTRSAKIIYSQKQLGYFAESFTQECVVDHVIAGQTTDQDRVLLYCGSGESGGFTDWYQYEFSGDRLTLVQQMTELGPPEKFDVKSAALLQLFHYKSGTEIESVLH